MICYLGLTFDEKTEINLEKDQIYIFDEEFNKEIKKNLDFMKRRKIFLIVCSVVATLGIIGEFVIVILNMIDVCCKKNKKNTKTNNKNNNNDINGIPEIVVYTVENSNHTNNVDSNNETDKRDI